MELEIKTAEELVDPALEARWVARREARLTDVHQAVLRAFRDRGGPVSLDAITVALPHLAPAVVREMLVALDGEDLIQLRGDRVEVAYPFSAIPTAFTVRFAGGAERYACCAIDALGMAPMLGEPVHIASHCHHCAGAPGARGGTRRSGARVGGGHGVGGEPRRRASAGSPHRSEPR